MDYKINLKMQEPIDFYDVCTIYQPTFDEILKYKIPNFEKLLLPYVISVDNINIELSDEQKNNIKNFDLVIGYQEIASYLFMSLEYFCKCNVLYDEMGIYFEGFEGRLNRDNFDEFGKIILDINARQKPVKERIPIFKNEKQKEIWYKLQEGQRRNALKNELKLEDVINIIQYGGNSYISKDEVRKFTLWEMMNCYKSILGISKYNDSFSIYLINGEKELVNQHWTELIKIDYKE